MKKLLVGACLILTTMLVYAQRGGKNAMDRVHQKVNHLTETLDLSTEQQEAIKAVLMTQVENRPTERPNFREMSEEERAAFKADRKAAAKEVNTKITEILTPEQQVAYEQLKADRKEKREKHKKGDATLEERTQMKTDRLAEKLGLNADQQTAVYELLLANAPQYNRAEFKNLSKEEKATLKAEGKEKRAKLEAELAEILTPEQLATYEAMKPKRGKKRRNR